MAEYNDPNPVYNGPVAMQPTGAATTPNPGDPNPVYGGPAPAYMPPTETARTPSPKSSWGYTAGVLAGYNPPVSDLDKTLSATVRTGINRWPGEIGSLLSGNAVANLGDIILGNEKPGFLTRHTWSADEINKQVRDIDSWQSKMLGLPEKQPLQQADDFGQKLAQDLIAVGPTLIGPGTARQIATRALVGAGGVTGTDVMANEGGSPREQLATGLLGAIAAGLATHGVLGGVKGAIQYTKPTKAMTEEAATKGFTKAAEQTPPQMLDKIDPYVNPPQRNFTGDVNDPVAVKAFLDEVAAAPPPPPRGQTTAQVTGDTGLESYNPMKPTGPATMRGDLVAGALTSGLGTAGHHFFGSGFDPMMSGLYYASGMGANEFVQGRRANWNNKVGDVGQQMLTDPAFAADLLRRYGVQGVPSWASNLQGLLPLLAAQREPSE